ncbi:MAG: glycosyltransferase [Terriglobia bacterium]|jgi:UDP:flavonoid glycosyltransferase YjiC (YdhE family)
MAKRILLTTTGSLGDLHPFIAIGLELRSRGHAVTLATSNFYRPKVEQTILKFAPMGPHLGVEISEVMDRVMDLKKGPEYLIRHLLYSSVPAAYAEVMEAVRGADLIVTHPITFAAQIAAEKTGMPWVSTVTAPLSFFSRFDPSVMAPYPSFIKLRALGPAFFGVIKKLARVVTKPWLGPITRFRASVGLPPGQDPILEGQHSPQRVLAMFSPLMGAPQPDWPAQTLVTGFPFYDQAEHGQGIDPDLERFLDVGPPPVVFTLGSSAVQSAGNFYHESIAAVQRLGSRAVLLVGGNSFQEPLPSGTVAFPYAPFSNIFSRAAVIVHQGGIGTCAQALAAGRPMLVVPFAFDQPDNAARLQRLGVGRTIPRKHYTAQRAFSELQPLLSDPTYAASAVDVAHNIAKENGVLAASDAIENHPLAR